MKTTKYPDDITLFLDDTRGIYLPRDFAESINREYIINREKWENDLDFIFNEIFPFFIGFHDFSPLLFVFVVKMDSFLKNLRSLFLHLPPLPLYKEYLVQRPNTL